MRISDWSSDVCSSDLPPQRCGHRLPAHAVAVAVEMESLGAGVAAAALPADPDRAHRLVVAATARAGDAGYRDRDGGAGVDQRAGPHFHHGLAADRAVDLPGLGTPAQQRLLGLVARSEETTSE